MNKFTKEELEVLSLLSKPVLTFDHILNHLNKNARKLGFESHDDLLEKTGWKDRFNDSKCEHESSVDNTKNDISFYHCSHCNEDVFLGITCPACGVENE